MEPLALEDDICILKHETAYSVAESPVSVCAGDEAVASHFALVTAYEDIKTRLKDSERENVLLRRRVKQLEDKSCLPEEPALGGQKYVNKVFNAYRGIYIEKKDLQTELNRVKQEKCDSEKMLTEQLQAKELELLQLRTEMETSQVMKHLNSSQDLWEGDKVHSELKIQSLQRELEEMKLQCRSLQKCCQERLEESVSGRSETQEAESIAGHSRLLQWFEDLRRTTNHLQVMAAQQSEVVRKLRDRPPNTHRRAASTIPVQCLDDVERNKQVVNMASARSPSAPPVPSSTGRPCPPAGPLVLEEPREVCWRSPWATPRPPPVGSSAVQPPPSPGLQSGDSLEDDSWSFPTPPKPSDALFWEREAAPAAPPAAGPPKSPSSDWLRPY